MERENTFRPDGEFKGGTQKAAFFPFLLLPSDDPQVERALFSSN